jgi:hypothetical protein
MKRVAVVAIAVGVAAAVSFVAWSPATDDVRRLGAAGSAPNTCPPWAPIVRVNAFGKKYCSAYDPLEGDSYVGVWASTAYADYWWRNQPCPAWAPHVQSDPPGSGYSLPRDFPRLTCSRYDVFGKLIYPLLPAAPPPPKPANAPDPCTGLPCPGLPPRGAY